MKACTKCKIPQALIEFHKSPVSKDGYHSWCKSCKRKNRPNPVAYWGKTYKLSTIEYTTLFEKHDGCCHICFVKPLPSVNNPNRRRLYIDHNHETGEVRGLLCMKCNTMLGFVDENPEIFKSAITYLAK
jgi:hypothetical protein